jgi:hypothetical protein
LDRSKEDELAIVSLLYLSLMTMSNHIDNVKLKVYATGLAGLLLATLEVAMGQAGISNI